MSSCTTREPTSSIDGEQGSSSSCVDGMMDADDNDPTTSKQDRKKKKPRRSCRRRRPARLDRDAARVVVVGSGLAGLGCAVALARAGFKHVSVYERDVSLAHQREGYGLTLTYNPKGPLAALGVLEDVARMDTPSRSHYLFRPHDGTPVGYFGNAFFSREGGRQRGQQRGRGQRGNMRVPRRVVRAVLHDRFLALSSPSSGVHWDHRLVECHWDGTACVHRMRFARGGGDGTTATPAAGGDGDTLDDDVVTVTADLLVAADGIRSTVLQNLHASSSKKKEEEEKRRRRRQPCSKDGAAEATRTSATTLTSKQRSELRPLGVRLILGIADFDHPLLDERGFYTLDAQRGVRLFTMPYRSNRFDNDDAASGGTSDEGGCGTSKAKTNRVMWQLSFATPLVAADGSGGCGAQNHRHKSASCTWDPRSLRDCVVETCRGWHPPVLDMIQATPLETVWGTDLMDRDPWGVWDDVKSFAANVGGAGVVAAPRLVVVGDALHSMSPFKGQGANQALADGPLLAEWLQKASIDAALKGWWRETLQRTAPIVQASREAAIDLHAGSNSCEEQTASAGRGGGKTPDVDGFPTKSPYHGFAGIQPDRIDELVRKLEEKKIGAHMGADLDRRVYEVIHENGFFINEEDSEPVTSLSSSSSSCQRQNEPSEHRPHHLQALQLSAGGDTQGLRLMSLSRQCGAIMDAREEGTQRSCLHLAAIADHLETCKWLLVELKMAPAFQTSVDEGDERQNSAVLDVYGKSPYHYALETGNKELIHIFKVVIREQQET